MQELDSEPIAQAVRLCPAATFFQGSFVHYRDASRAVRHRATP